MDLSKIIDLIKLITAGGIVGLVLSYVHRAKKTSEERDQLLREQKLNRLKTDEEEVTKKFNTMPLTDLVKSAQNINRKSGNNTD